MYQQLDIDKLLAAVIKPSRYINNEINSYHKRPSADTVNFCFAFPDLYEVGFSHLGLKLLYTIINKEQDATADRVYAPDKDLAELLKQNHIPLFALENKIPIKDYDVIGFTLQSELTYTNILYMLDLADIPLLRKDRTQIYPLIIAGGPGSVNPEPLTDFIDLFFIGEAEEGLVEIKDIIKKGKDKNLSRNELLLNLSKIVGVYIPELAEREGTKHKVTARKYSNFSYGVTYSDQLISWQQTTHDRYIYEIMRGCSRGCRFCLAGYLYRPVREREAEAIISQLVQEVLKYGWEETALLSLSSADYTCIKPLIKLIIERLSTFKTDISLPSMRIDSLDDDIIKLLNKTGQSGITIAPEAGSQKLRDIINKDLTEEQILDLVRIAANNNWKNIKLYFMIGLPYETDEDVEEIVNLVRKISAIGKNRIRISITLSPFIPKPHTPFQWAEMQSIETLISRINVIRSSLSKMKWIKVKYHTLENSLLECILTRGNHTVGKLIYQAYRNGAYFDGWDENFNFSYWKMAAEELNIDLNEFTRSIDPSTQLPYDYVSLGIDKDFLIKEYNNAATASPTKDCRYECTNCGLCNEEIRHITIEDTEALKTLNQSIKTINAITPSPPPGSYKYRLYYAKEGLLKYVAHLDMLRMMYRIVRRTGLPIKYTEGYNKHPKIYFCSPLSVGIAGNNEFFDLELIYPGSCENILNRLRDLEIRDLRWNDVKEIDFDNLPKANEYLYEDIVINLPAEYGAVFKEKTIQFNRSISWDVIKIKKGLEKKVDLKDIIVSMDYRENKEDAAGTITLIKKINGGSVFDILKGVFEMDREITGNLNITRQSLLTANDMESR